MKYCSNKFSDLYRTPNQAWSDHLKESSLAASHADIEMHVSFTTCYIINSLSQTVIKNACLLHNLLQYESRCHKPLQY